MVWSVVWCKYRCTAAHCSVAVHCRTLHDASGTVLPCTCTTVLQSTSKYLVVVVKITVHCELGIQSNKACA